MWRGSMSLGASLKMGNPPMNQLILTIYNLQMFDRKISGITETGKLSGNKSLRMTVGKNFRVRPKNANSRKFLPAKMSTFRV